MSDEARRVRVAIIGSGPAGLTAALYAARAELKPLLVSGVPAGGQLLITTDVENYPGFPEGVQGPELIELMRRQAARFGTEFVDDNVTKVDFSVRPFHLLTGTHGTFVADAVIVATGATARWLGLASEDRLKGHGVSACATCDGFFFKGKEIVVVGGGDTAMEEALFLTNFATHVTIVHRRDALRASPIMQRRAQQHPKVSFELDTCVEEVLGAHQVEGVRLRHLPSGRTREIRAGGLFIAIGHDPSTEVFRGQLELNREGYLAVRDHTRTSVEGVFAAGDVHDHRYRQAVTAAGSGCMAAIDAERWLAAQEVSAPAEAAKPHAAPSSPRVSG
jgi:thioredoxin reductase (NADPH)